MHLSILQRGKIFGKNTWKKCSRINKTNTLNDASKKKKFLNSKKLRHEKLEKEANVEHEYLRV